MGHSLSGDVTDIYTFLGEEQLRDAVASIDRFFAGIDVPTSFPL
jgi:hypothetical protein